jgi:UDP-N-acetylbacillosamine alanyltransferase
LNVLVDLERAQSEFTQLPAALQLSTLSPAHCAADAARDAGLTPRFLLFRSGAALLLHSVHEAAIASGGTDWQSPYGYGGPIAVNMTESLLQAAWAAFDQTARERAVVAEFVRFHPLADNHHWYPGNVREDRRVVALNLPAGDLAASYTSRGRNTLRKAQQQPDISVTWEEPLQFCEEFADLYRAAMRRIGTSDFYLFGPAYFDALLRLPCARVLAVRLATQVVAAGVFLFGPAVVEYHLSGTTPEGRRCAATNLLLHEAARRAQAEGCNVLYLGGGTDSDPDNPLLRFKESFAPASHTFRFGSRILDPVGYERLRQEFPEQARNSRRVLFYRAN